MRKEVALTFVWTRVVQAIRSVPTDKKWAVDFVTSKIELDETVDVTKTVLRLKAFSYIDIDKHQSVGKRCFVFAQSCTHSTKALCYAQAQITLASKHPPSPGASSHPSLQETLC